MMRIQSRTLAKGDTSLRGSPFDPMNGTGDAAADIFAVGGREDLSNWRNARKLTVSSGLLRFPGFPSRPGYSQSMSIPSRSYLWKTVTRLLTKVWREVSVATAGEKNLMWLQC